MSAADEVKRIERALKIGQYLFVPGTFDGWNCRAVDGSGAAMRVKERATGVWEWEVSASAEGDHSSAGEVNSRDEAIENCVTYMERLGVNMEVFPTEARAARALVENGEVMPVIANDFNDAHRYNTPVKSRLVLFLPVTDYRPEAMRVSERTNDKSTWYEVESFSKKLGRWIEQKSHAEERKALDDIASWYPAPAARGVAVNLAQKSGEFFSSDLIAIQRGALDSHEATGYAILGLPRTQSSYGEMIRYEDVCKLLAARYDKPVEVADVKRWAEGDIAKFGKNNEREVQVFPGLFRVSGFGLGNYYGVDHAIEWLDADAAGARADAQGVKFVRWDADQSYPPLGVKLEGGRTVVHGQAVESPASDAKSDLRIDLAALEMADIEKAVEQSKWIPPQYVRNDWLSDVCRFLRDGPAAFGVLTQDWDGGHEAKDFAEGKELATLALKRAGLVAAGWEHKPQFADYWEFTDVKVGEDQKITLGVSSGGVVQVNGDPFTKRERKMNVTLAAVQESVAYAVAQLQSSFKNTVHIDPRDVQPNELNQRAGVLPVTDVERIAESYLTHGVLGDITRHKEQLVAMGREVEQGVLAELDAQQELSEEDKAAGFVFAFPEMSSAERDELLEALRDGGNTVVPVYGGDSQSILKAAHRELAGGDNDLGMG